MQQCTNSGLNNKLCKVYAKWFQYFNKMTIAFAINTQSTSFRLTIKANAQNVYV